VASQTESAYVAVARIQTTHGRRGEVAADVLTDFPERFRPGMILQVTQGNLNRNFRLEEAWFHKRRVILKLQGVDTMTEAATLAGALVEVPRSERYPLPAGRLYVSDLIGSTVVEQDRVLGKVVDWEETGGVPLLKVQGAEGEILIPYTPEICYSVDGEKKEIQVHTPEGLTELNRDAAGRRKRSHAPQAPSRLVKTPDDD